MDQVQELTPIDYLQHYKEPAISFEDDRYVTKLPNKNIPPCLLTTVSRTDTLKTR